MALFKPMMSSKKILIALCIWLLAALIAGASGLFYSLVPPFPQAVLLGLVIVLLLVFAFVPPASEPGVFQST